MDAITLTAALTADLDVGQTRAVESTAPVTVVRAGPGSGKTRVLVERVRSLIDAGVEPSRILVLAFTRVAAAEVRHRLTEAGEPELPVVTTFHGWCSGFVRRHADQAEVRPDFTVQDREESDWLVCEVGAELGLKWKSARRLRQELSVQRRVAQRMQESGRIDLDQIEGMANALLDLAVDHGFEHILVDEAQDTSEAEQTILRKMGKQGAALFLVGDTSQSLYRFRGAHPGGFVEFAPEPVELRVNYRSSRAVVDAARRLQLTPPPVQQVPRVGAPEGVAMLADDETSERMGWPDAVLAPTWRQLEGIASLLELRGVPYVYARPRRLWHSPAGRRVLASLRLLACPHDRLAAELLLGDDARSPAWRRALAEVIERHGSALEALSLGPWNLPIVAADLERASGVPLLEVLDHLAQAEGLEDPAREALLFAAAEVGQPGELVTALLEEDIAEHDEPEGAVVLSTIHGAKGREWDAVWVLGCEEGGMRGSDDDCRRLLYVATTRARRECLWVVPAGAEPSRFVREMQGGVP